MRYPPLVFLSAMFLGTLAVAQIQVAPFRETDPGVTGGTVQDVALWVDPALDGGTSLLITADSLNGLVTFGLDGQPLQQIPQGATTSVGLVEGFPLGSAARTLLISNASSSGLVAYTVDPLAPPAQRLRLVGNGAFLSTGTAYDTLSLYRSPLSGRFYAVGGTSNGTFQQFELSGVDGGVTATPVRTVTVGASVTGLVADEDYGALYVVEPGNSLWRYGLEPDAGSDRTRVLPIPGTQFSTNVRRLALYRAPGQEGYLLVTDTGNSRFVVLDRQTLTAQTPAVLGAFAVVADGGTVDSVTLPRALVVASQPVGPEFRTGLFVAQDSENALGTGENLKLVHWGTIADAFNPPLRGGSRFGPDGGADGGVDAGDAGSVTGRPVTGGGRGADDSGCSCATASVPATALLGLLVLALAGRRRRS